MPWFRWKFSLPKKDQEYCRCTRNVLIRGVNQIFHMMIQEGTVTSPKTLNACSVVILSQPSAATHTVLISAIMLPRIAIGPIRNA